MNLRKAGSVFLFLTLLFVSPAISSAFPPQSVEFMPGYKVPDLSSDGAFSYDLRYFIHFPSLYLAAGVGIGHINAPANHKNLAIGSNLEMTPIGLTVRLLPPLSESFVTFFEIGVDRLSQLRYQLDPSIDTGETDFCFPDTGTGPSPCKITTIRKRSYAYRVGIGVEKVFQSHFGVGLHYTYRFAEPISKTVTQSPSLGIQATESTSEDLFDIKQSIFSVLISYHFR